MKQVSAALAFICVISLAAEIGLAQPPRPERDRSNQNSNSSQQTSPVNRLFKYDADQDGALTKDEVTDRRIHRILAAADKNSDERVTREELSAYFEKQSQAYGTGSSSRANSPSGPLGQDGGPPMGGPFPPGPGPGFAPPRPGQLLPPVLQQQLQLNSAQQSRLAELQSRVDAELARILTPDQQRLLLQMSQPSGGPPFGPPGQTRDR